MEFDNWIIHIGKRIRERRSEVNLTQEALSEKAGVDTSYIGQIERGKQTPSLRILWRLSKALNLPPSEFLSMDASSFDSQEELRLLFEGLSLSEQSSVAEIIRLVIEYKKQ